MAGKSIKLERFETPPPFDPSVVIKLIAADMEKEVQLRFRKEEDPQGKKWTKLSPVTVSRRRKGSSKVMQDTGIFKSSITRVSTKNEAVVGTNAKQAKTMQFGAKQGSLGKGKHVVPWGDIPARAYLGFSKRQITKYGNQINIYVQKQKKIVKTF